MALRILEEPEIVVRPAMTLHVLAIDTPGFERETDEPFDFAQVEPGTKVAGVVALQPGVRELIWEWEKEPYKTHETMTVTGMVGDRAVYDKIVSPNSLFLGMPKPLYGLRIAVAKRRAANRVRSILS